MKKYFSIAFTLTLICTLAFGAEPATLPNLITWIVNSRLAPADSPLVACTRVAPGSYSVIGYSTEAEPISFTITISTSDNPLPPVPIPPGPVIPVGNLTATGRATRDAWKAYTRDMAANYETLAMAKYATVIDAAAEGTKLDEKARIKLKAAMRNVMEPELGSGDLPSHAPRFFREMAAGFSEAGK